MDMTNWKLGSKHFGDENSLKYEPSKIYDHYLVKLFPRPPPRLAYLK